MSRAIDGVKTYMTGKYASGSLLWKILYPGMRFCWRSLRFLSNRRYRRHVLLTWFPSGNLHQISDQTELDRYPDIFYKVRQYFEGTGELKLLSFGCSTGEEVFTLRSYFPESVIVGTDINRRSLRICKRKNRDGRNLFIPSESNLLKAKGPYDAIFCMAVFQRTENKYADCCDSIYPFALYEKQVLELHELVKAGGLLVIHCTNFRFSDTSIYQKYEVLDAGPIETKLPKFDRSNRLIKEQYHDVVFIKRHY